MLRLLFNRKQFIAFAGFLVAIFTIVGYGAYNLYAQNTQQVFGVVDAKDMASPFAGLGMDQKVSLEFKQIDANDVLKYLAQKVGMNIMISPQVTGRVTLFVNDVSVRDVFEIVLKGNGLAYRKEGEVFHIMTEAEYEQLFGTKFSDLREVRAFRLKYAGPEMAFNFLDTLKSDIGRLLIDEHSGTVMIMDTPDRLDEMQAALKVLEQQAVMKVYELKYAIAADVQEKLIDEFDANRLGMVEADERTNSLIIKTFPDRLAEVEGLIEALDRKTREVLINARIIKVTMTDDVDAGVDWNFVFQNLKFNGIDNVGDFRNATDATTPGSEVPAVTPIQIAPKLGLSTDGPFGAENLGKLIFTTVSRDGYELFRYLNTIGETKIISKPRLLVTENEEAKIHVGTREAYVTTTTTTGTSTATVAEEVQFIDVGIKFTVTPRILKDGFIEMKIAPEVSSVVRTLLTQSGNQIPIVDTSIAETRVIVKDGASVVIGGLRKREEKHEDDEVPYLAKIPLIGKVFFTQKEQDNEMQELIILITPHIVHGDKMVTGDESEYGGDFKKFVDYDSSLAPKNEAVEDNRGLDLDQFINDRLKVKSFK